MKENFSPLQAGCGEQKFLPLPAECGDKKFSTAKIANLANNHRANFNAYLIFTGNIIEVSDRWHSGSWHSGRWHSYEVGDTHEVEVQTLDGSCFFVRIPVNAVKKIFHRKFQRNSYKNSPLSAHSTLKDACAFRGKSFFSPLFTANLTLFFVKTSTRVVQDLLKNVEIRFHHGLYND